MPNIRVVFSRYLMYWLISLMCITKFYIFYTVHLHIALVDNQLDAQFLPWYVCLNPLHVSSNYVLILRRTNCMNTTSGIITLKISEWSKITKITRIHRGWMQPRCILVILVILDHSLIFRVIIPDVVFIQFVLLRMST